MGKDCGFMFPSQQLNSVSLVPNTLRPLSHPRQQETVSSKNGGIDMISVNGVFPVRTQFSDSHVWQEKERIDWFSRLPRFHQAFGPSQNSCLKDAFPGSTCENHIQIVMPQAGAECAQKRFLVFDQSGDKPALVFSSGGKPSWLPTSCSPKAPGTYDVNIGILRTKEDLNLDHGLMIPSEDYDENTRPDMGSEMREDTEELNALLYSDDESVYSDDDEVTSSGHSPSTISAHVDHEVSVGSTEGFGALVGHNKKRKFLDVCNDETLSLLNIPNSIKRNALGTPDENDAESSCANGDNSGSIELYTSSGIKRMKREKICETVSLLRRIVPGGEGEGPVAVLDKAIGYLKTLKLKAKSLGLDSL